MNFARAALLMIMLTCGGAAVAQDAPMAIKGAKTVDADAVIALIESKSNLVILDNRHAADFDAGHIEGAIRLIDTDVTAPAVLAALIKTKDTPVLFYCNGLKCGRAAKAAEKAVEWGYADIYYYALGVTEWKSKGLPLVVK